MHVMRWIVVWIAWCLIAAGSAFAEDEVKVELTISAVSGGGYYVDKGRGDGLANGDRVVLFARGGLRVEGTIRAVAKSSARVELDAGSAAVAIGDRGEALIPKDRVAPPPAQSPPAPDTATPAAPVVPPAQQPVAKPAPVEHPPWTHPPEEWQKDQPLLAPAFGLRPEERDRRLRGRAWLQAQYTKDSENGSRTYTQGSAGVDSTLENPFGHGGELRFSATAWTRSFDVGAVDLDDTESDLRLNRFSYTVGGTDDAPTRWSFGRFLQTGMPELGLLDGAEWNTRFSNGDVVGVSAGWMPLPNSSLTSFDDMQIAAFYRRALDDAHKSSIALAYQNTWHEGQQDRNLFVAQALIEAGRDVSIWSTAWVDVYGSEDEIKGSGFELTELLAGLTWRATPSTGLGVTLSHRRIPELLRDELQDFEMATIKDSEVDRIALNGWTNVSAKVRIDGRVDHWTDQSDDGTAGELGAAFRDLVWDRGELRTSIFYAEGSYSSGPGARVTASKAFGRSAASLGYEYVDYEQKGFLGEQEQLAQQALFGTIDLPLTEAWDLSLIGDKRFGDRQDSWTLGFMLQTRF